MSVFDTPTFALLKRSLREDQRLKQTYYTRGGLICFILVMLYSSQNSFAYEGAPGLSFFSQVVLTNFFFITLTGLSYFAGAVAEEKEEGTLGLLRMTNLDPATILLGKSSSRLLGSALLLFVQLPFTLLAVTLGGVSTHQVLAAYASLGAYIFFVCNLALLFSVVSGRVSTASLFTGLTLLAFFFAPPWGEALTEMLTTRFHVSGHAPALAGLDWLLRQFTAASVYTRLELILSNGFAGGLFPFQVWSNLALGVGFFGLAWLGFDRFTREHRPGSLARGLPRWPTVRFGLAGAGRTWPLAVGWKDFFLLHGGWSAALVKLIGYGALTALIEYNVSANEGRPWTPGHARQLGESMLSTFLMILAAELAFGASRMFRAEIQGKTLAGLVGLPTSVARIAYQKLGALLLSTLPVGGFLAAGALLMVANEARHGGAHLVNKTEWQAYFIFGTQGLLFLHLAAYFSLSIRRLSLAVALTAMVVGNMVFAALANTLFRLGEFNGVSENVVMMYHGALLVLTGWLHVRIGLRLKRLAAAEG